MTSPERKASRGVLVGLNRELAASDAEVKEKLRKGLKGSTTRTSKIGVDGYYVLPTWQAKKRGRRAGDFGVFAQHNRGLYHRCSTRAASPSNEIVSDTSV